MNVSAADICFWGLDSENSRQTIALYCELAEAPDPVHLERRLRLALQEFPKLSMRRQAQPSVEWQPVVVDMEYHLSYRKLPTSSPGLQSAAEAAFSDALDHSRPLWRFFIFSNPQQQHAVLYTIHHSLADGLSGMALFFTLCEASKEERPQLNTRALKSLRRTSAWSRSRLLPSIKRLLLDGLQRPHRHPLRGRNSNERKLVFLQYPLSVLHYRRSEQQLTVNDFVLLAISTALGSFLEQRAAVDRSIAALIPINSRATEDTRDLGNRLSALRLPLPSHRLSFSEAATDLQLRLRAIQNDGSFGAYALLSNLLARLPVGIRRALLRFAAHRIDCICTNAPGPKQAQFFAGARIVRTHGIPALMPSQGIGFAAVRYQDQLNLSIVHDPAILPEVKEIVEELNAFFAEAQQLGHCAAKA